MSLTYTDDMRLRKPSSGDALWGTAYNLNFDDISKMLGGLAVRSLEVPSTSLKITVAPGPYILTDRVLWHPGTSVARTLPANSTRVVYLLADEITDEAAGDPTHPFPDGSFDTPIIPLAVVTTGPTTITSITHWRYIPRPNLPWVDGPYNNDATAGAAGVRLGQLYRDTSGIVHQRIA